MRTHLFLLMLCIYFNTSAQTINQKQIKSKVDEVVVYIDGAQLTHHKQISLDAGTTVLKFTDLSPFIDAKTIKVKAVGKITVLSVNHQLNYIDPIKKNEEIKQFEQRIKTLEDNNEIENTYLEILNAELDFLSTNKKISSSENELTLTNLKETSQFYASRNSEIKLAEINHRKTIESNNLEIIKIQNQLANIRNKKEFPTGEILLKIESKAATDASFVLSYMVGNAGWYPSYDIRVNSINEPVELVYKANVHQDTKVDWENVKIKFSSNEPVQTLIAPELKNYLLSYNMLPPTYESAVGQVHGQIIGANDNLPIPGVNIMVKGTTIGTISDANGNYRISLPANATTLLFSFIGYLTEEITVNNEVVNVNMQEDIASLDEVVVVGYGVQRKSDVTGAVSSLQGRVAGIQIRGISSQNASRQGQGATSIPIQTVQIRNKTSFEFEIGTPYTIASDNRNYTINMQTNFIPAYYEYKCIPKITEAAFLQASITDFQQYNLVEGEANIFFEDTYIGKSILDVRYLSDTLNISLGRDKNIIVKRTAKKDLVTRKILSNKMLEEKAWSIVVKNNKSEAINISILDQVPVSLLDDIKVDINEISENGILFKENGKVEWKFSLNSLEQTEQILRYSVEYPKYGTVIVE